MQAVAACLTAAILSFHLLFLSILASAKPSSSPYVSLPAASFYPLLCSEFLRCSVLTAVSTAHNTVGSCCLAPYIKQGSHSLPLAFAFYPIFFSSCSWKPSLPFCSQRAFNSSETTAAKQKGSSDPIACSDTAGFIDWGQLLIFEHSLGNTTEIISTSAISYW